MITAKDHQTGWIFDPWKQFGPKRRKLLENSWPSVFRTYLLNKLPVDVVARYFHECLGRPSKELYTAIGALILQELHDLSDADVVHAVAFYTDWHYALDITDNSDDSTYICERTLRTYSAILIKENLDKALFETLTDKMIAVFGVDTSKQRLDSSVFRSNMRKLGRIRICARTIEKFLKKLKRTHKDLFAAHITAEITDRYLVKNANSHFSRVKPSESSKKLADIGNDLLYLIELFSQFTTVCELPEYRLLDRVLREQFTVTGTGSDVTVTVRPPKEVSPDSLQNPSDPDAGYDGHKGQGYKVQVMETYHEKQDGQLTLDLITHVDVEPAHEHDADALIPAIEDVQERDCCPDELLCDTLYGGDDNVQQAESYGVEVVAPVPGHSPEHDFTSFSFDPETMFITTCPAGHAPDVVKRTKKGKISARFHRKTCSCCPHLNRCPAKIGKKAAFIRYDDKIVRLTQRRAYEQTDAFKHRYRWRAGIEASISHLKADLGLGRLRVRGMKSVRRAVYLKALGLNILRCAKARAAGFSPVGGRICAHVTGFVNRLIARIPVFTILLSKNRCCRCSGALYRV